MTATEFSNEFDTLVDSYKRFKDFDNKEILDSIEFNEYEKSVFLTQAQEDIIVSFYNGLNSTGKSFEGSEEIRRYLNSLVKTQKSVLKVENLTTSKINANSVFFALPENDDVWFIIYEAVYLEDITLNYVGKKEVPVIPTTHDNLQKILKNPFRKPNERRVLRLDITGNVVELISAYDISDYIMRYISKPKPIVLADLPDSLTINGENKKKECSLNPVIHRMILELAVNTALVSKLGNTAKQK